MWWRGKGFGAEDLGELARMVVRGMCGVFEGWERGGGHLVCRGQLGE